MNGYIKKKSDIELITHIIRDLELGAVQRAKSRAKELKIAIECHRCQR